MKKTKPSKKSKFIPKIDEEPALIADIIDKKPKITLAKCKFLEDSSPHVQPTFSGPIEGPYTVINDEPPTRDDCTKTIYGEPPHALPKRSAWWERMFNIGLGE